MHVELRAALQPGARIQHVVKVRVRQQHSLDRPPADRTLHRRKLRAGIDQEAFLPAARSHDVGVDLQRPARDRSNVEIIHQNVLLESTSSVTGPSLTSETFMSVWKMPVSTCTPAARRPSQ